MVDLKYGYLIEQLGKGVRILASGDLPLRERLLHAFHQFHPIFSDHILVGMPEDLKKELKDLEQRLTELPDPTDNLGTAAVTINSIPIAEVREVAEKIVSLFEQACELYYGNPRGGRM